MKRAEDLKAQKVVSGSEEREPWEAPGLQHSSAGSAGAAAGARGTPK